MLYYSNEARRTAIKTIDDLVVKLASTKPTETLTLQDIGNLIHYLSNMTSELKQEMKKDL